jgi:hypothetical protein
MMLPTGFELRTGSGCCFPFRVDCPIRDQPLLAFADQSCEKQKTNGPVWFVARCSPTAAIRVQFVPCRVLSEMSRSLVSHLSSQLFRLPNFALNVTRFSRMRTGHQLNSVVGRWDSWDSAEGPSLIKRHITVIVCQVGW